MNNAANNIDAKSKSLKDVLFEKHYKVGYFQREYKWQRNHIEDLLVDLERSFNSNWSDTHTQKDVANYDKYYMGPIVLFLDNSEFSIVDGQQRITSFILLMIFLNHKYFHIMNTKSRYAGYIYSEHYGVESYNMNIPERNDMLNFLYTGENFDESILDNESCQTILDRYNDITELFPTSLLKESVFPLFTNWLTEKLVFIEILTQTSESAYTIFETMNDRGLNLTQTELLKSFLLSNVNDELKIKELDTIWKEKMAILNSLDDDQDFFKAWLRAKYAISIRSSEKDSENKDFEKIGTRFSSWVQENTKFKEKSSSILLLDSKDADTFYFFVKSDFSFYADLYIKLKNFEISDELPEHRFKLLSYRGVSPSLSYPLILSSIEKTDSETLINEKIDAVVKYLDSFGAFRLLLSEPITHSAIRNSMYTKIKDIRNLDIESLKEKLRLEISNYKLTFLKEDYLRLDINSRYILSRLIFKQNEEIDFESIYFQRKKDSLHMYPILKKEDFETESHGLPKALKERIVSSVCNITMVPRSSAKQLDELPLIKRIPALIKADKLFEDPSTDKLDPNNLKDFFIKREKKIKDLIINYWKI